MAGLDPTTGDAALGSRRSARRAAPTRSSASPTWSARSVRIGDLALRAFVPGGGRLRRRAARHRRLDQEHRRHRRDRRRRRAAVRRRRVRPAERVATPTGDVAWTSEALMFRGLGAPAAVGESVVVRRLERHAALVLARQGRVAGARHDRRQRDRDAAGERRRRARRRHAQRRRVRVPPRLIAASHGDADEARHRPRRPAQRRQVDALQPHDEDARRDRRRLRRA